MKPSVTKLIELLDKPALHYPQKIMETIKPQELRIGNFVKANGTHHGIEGFPGVVYCNGVPRWG